MKRTAFAAIALLSAAPAMAETFDEMFPGHAGYEEDGVDDFLSFLDYQTGTVTLPGGQVVLTIPNGYYYLSPADAEAVLVDLWGNPYGDNLGMIFPSSITPADFSGWGAEIQFEDIGYVSDEDAETYDYDALLREMQADVRTESEDRLAQGYDSVRLIGWAEPPTYDRSERKLHWAKELEFGGSKDHTLNYFLRALGREGVLNLNFIAGMDALPEVKAALPDIARMVSFVDGKRYADFDPAVDKVAAVGIAGLIAGKALGKGAGLFALGLILLKKFGFLVILPFAWIGNRLRRS